MQTAFSKLTALPVLLTGLQFKKEKEKK